jgi:uncharacterized membrane protein YphA (DoxX/SURF4 family)
MRVDYGSVLIAAVLLVAVSQTLDGVQTPIGLFFRGAAVGLAIVCSVVGLVLYGRSSSRT